MQFPFDYYRFQTVTKTYLDFIVASEQKYSNSNYRKFSIGFRFIYAFFDATKCSHKTILYNSNWIVEYEFRWFCAQFLITFASRKSQNDVFYFRCSLVFLLFFFLLFLSFTHTHTKQNTLNIHHKYTHIHSMSPHFLRHTDRIGIFHP